MKPRMNPLMFIEFNQNILILYLRMGEQALFQIITNLHWFLLKLKRQIKRRLLAWEEVQRVIFLSVQSMEKVQELFPLGWMKMK
jgi:hypothetical protein